MAFKMKGPSMHMGTSSHKKAHGDAVMKKKAAAYKKTYEEAYKDRDMSTYGDMSQEEYTKEAKRQKAIYDKTGKWDVKGRPSKDSNVTTKKTATGGTKVTKTEGDKTTTKKTSKSGNRTVTTVDSPDMKGKKVEKGGEEKRVKMKTGLSTEDKSDDKTVKRRRTLGGGKREVLKTGDGTKTVRRTKADGSVKEKTKNKDRVIKRKKDADGNTVGEVKSRKTVGGMLRGNRDEPRRKQTSKRSVKKAANEMGWSQDSEAAKQKAFYDNARPKKNPTK